MMRGPAFWNTKHPKRDLVYAGRPIPSKDERFPMDLRRFIWADDVVIKQYIDSFAPLYSLPNQRSDHMAYAVHQFVRQRIKYVADTTLGTPEFWLFPTETTKLGQGDCEDGAILIVSILRNLGMPAWRIRVAAGYVQSEGKRAGHAWATYCRETDEAWIPLDWCYWPEDYTIPVKENPKYFGGDQVWFSFNDENAWSEFPSHEVKPRSAQ
jgi:hypothetical protein